LDLLTGITIIIVGFSLSLLIIVFGVMSEVLKFIREKGEG